MSYKKVSITFDLDDTLIPTQELLYDRTREKLSIHISKLLNVPNLTPEAVLDVFTVIDLKNVKTDGFSRKRFPKSWVQTLEKLSSEREATINLDREKEMVWNMANWIFEAKLSPYPVVRYLLKDIESRGVELNLLTAGEREIQEKRIDDAGLRAYFDNVVIVPMKTPAVMKEYLSGKEEWLNIMIGNSLKSDIYPALECGMFAIHIEKGSWAYDHFEMDTLNKQYVKSTLENIPNILNKLHVPKPYSYF